MSVSSRGASRLVLLAGCVLLGATLNANASPINLVTNGGFESTTSPGTSSELNYNGFNVTGWTSALASNGAPGYNFLYTSGTATAPGASGNVTLWNGNNGGQAIPASPDGGNFIGMDGVYEPGALSQLITGLVVGQDYSLTFFYAGAQQYGFNGATTEGFTVTFGNQTYNTPMLSDASHSFTGWQQQNVTFTATSASQTLSFLAKGTPNGEPPFSLLDGVTLTSAATPEPSSLALLGTGALGVIGAMRRRLFAGR